MSRTVLAAGTAVFCLWTSPAAQSNRGSASQGQATVRPHLSFLGFSLEKNTLDDVRAKLGNSESRKCSREEGASSEICYAGPDGTKVVFEAGFSGAWTELDGYRIISAQLSPQCYSRCPATSLVNNDLRTEGGLRLGLTRQEVMQLLGKPTRATRNRLTFEWQSRRPMTKEEIEKAGKTSSLGKDAYWDVLDTIDVTLSNGKVADVAVHRTVTD